MSKRNLSLTLCCFVVVSLTAAWAQAQPRLQAASSSSSAKETLTNVSIVELAQLGFSDAVIIEKIHQSDCRFDTSLNGLKQLKAARVTDAVLAAMMNPTAKPASPTAANAASSPTSLSFTGNTPPATNAANVAKPVAAGVRDSRGNAVALPPDKGAYLWDGNKHTLLTQNQVSQMGANVGSLLKSAVVPFAKNKLELQLIGSNAQASFDDQQPVILLSGLGDVIPGVPSYRLLYVKQGGMRKDRRILGTYDIGGFGSVAMVDNEIPCEIKKVADGIYALKPQRPLRDGEYGLVPVTRAADMQSNSKSMGMPPVWDFGIYAEGKNNAR